MIYPQGYDYYPLLVAMLFVLAPFLCESGKYDDIFLAKITNPRRRSRQGTRTKERALLGPDMVSL